MEGVSIEALNNLTNTLQTQIVGGLLLLMIVGAFAIIMVARFVQTMASTVRTNALDDTERVKRLETNNEQMQSLFVRQVEITAQLAAANVERAAVQTAQADTMKQQAAYLENMLKAIQELNANFRSWPSLVNDSLDGIGERIGRLEADVTMLQKLLHALPGEHAIITRKLDELAAQIDEVRALIASAQKTGEETKAA